LYNTRQALINKIKDVEYEKESTEIRLAQLESDFSNGTGGFLINTSPLAGGDPYKYSRYSSERASLLRSIDSCEHEIAELKNRLNNMNGATWF
jgi:hypothetical protein